MSPAGSEIVLPVMDLNRPAENVVNRGHLSFQAGLGRVDGAIFVFKEVVARFRAAKHACYCRCCATDHEIRAISLRLD